MRQNFSRAGASPNSTAAFTTTRIANDLQSQISPLEWSERAWRDILKTAIRDAATLAQRVGLKHIPSEWDTEPSFGCFVPTPFLQRIKYADPADPLLRQVAPLLAERDLASNYAVDPLAESNATIAPGWLKKYNGRALNITTTECAIHCRYCFRREFPYDAHKAEEGIPDLRAIAADRSLSELILSGGEPLLLSDPKIATLLDRMSDLKHIKRVRIHTRLPVVIPQRVTSALVKALARSRFNMVVVLHINHAQELDQEVGAAAALLKRNNCTLLNQSVLLNGVNDDADTQCELAEAVFEIGVLPYYLHLPDKVQGTQHFDVSEEKAQRIHHEMRRRLPGYLVPRLVREVPDRPAKEPLDAKPV